MEYDGKSSKLNINNNRNKRKINKYDFNYSLNENINQNNYEKKDEKDSLNIFNKIIGNNNFSNIYFLKDYNIYLFNFYSFFN